jgi:hypothetical protein
LLNIWPLLQEQDPHAALFDAYKAFISQITKLDQQARYWSLRLLLGKE